MAAWGLHFSAADGARFDRFVRRYRHESVLDASECDHLQDAVRLATCAGTVP